MTSDSVKQDFLGIPKIGDGDHRSRRSTVKQRPASELKAKIVELFESPHIMGLTWSQYIPYFNDGDVCEFTTTEVYVADSRAPEEDGWDYMDAYDDEGEGVAWVSSYTDYEWYETGETRLSWDKKTQIPVRDYNAIPKPWTDEKTAELAEEVMGMIGPEFYDALEENFGTYARVLFKKVDGELKAFVEEYDPGH